MKILIIGPLGAGKSSLAYAINKKYNFPRLNLDEVSRIKGSGYRSIKEQISILNDFLKSHNTWVIEGSQKTLYEKVNPDLIIDMRINRLVAIFRFTLRVMKAKKLTSENTAPDSPVQPYHYRKITLKRILQWDNENNKLNTEIKNFLNHTKIPIITCKKFKEYPKIFNYIENQ